MKTAVVLSPALRPAPHVLLLSYLKSGFQPMNCLCTGHKESRGGVGGLRSCQSLITKCGTRVSHRSIAQDRPERFLHTGFCHRQFETTAYLKFFLEVTTIPNPSIWVSVSLACGSTVNKPQSLDSVPDLVCVSALALRTTILSTIRALAGHTAT